MVKTEKEKLLKLLMASLPAFNMLMILFSKNKSRKDKRPDNPLKLLKFNLPQLKIKTIISIKCLLVILIVLCVNIKEAIYVKVKLKKAKHLIMKL